MKGPFRFEVSRSHSTVRKEASGSGMGFLPSVFLVCGLATSWLLLLTTLLGRELGSRCGCATTGNPRPGHAHSTAASSHTGSWEAALTPAHSGPRAGPEESGPYPHPRSQ